MDDAREYRPEGIFSGKTMGSLLDEISVTGAFSRVIVHMDRVQIFLAEAASELADRLVDIKDSGLQEIKFLRLSEGARLQLQFYGMPVQGSTARILASDLTGIDAIPESGEALIRTCSRCSHKMKIFGSGTYACPSCGARFFSDSAGRMEYYESLPLLQR